MFKCCGDIFELMTHFHCQFAIFACYSFIAISMFYFHCVKHIRPIVSVFLVFAVAWSEKLKQANRLFC